MCECMCVCVCYVWFEMVVMLDDFINICLITDFFFCCQGELVN